jgi:hypothetical protein
MTSFDRYDIVAVHYPVYACARCEGRGICLTPVSREDYPCSHIRYKRVPPAPEVVVRERLEAERERAEFSARMCALLETL